MPGFKRPLGALIALLAVGAAVAGCGSTSSNKSSTATGSGSQPSASSASGSSGGNAADKQFVAAHSSLTGLKYPMPPNKPYAPGHGTLGVVTCATAGSGCIGMAKQVVAAAKAAGWTPTPIGDGKFTPSVQSGLIQQDVQQHVNGIVIVSIDLGSVRAAVDAALAAHIPVSCVSCTPSPGFNATGPVPLSAPNGYTTGEYIGKFIAANSRPGTTILQFRDKAFPIIVERANAVAATIKSDCPGCKYSEQDIATAQLTQPGPPYLSAALSAHPQGSLDWAFVASDTYNIPAVKTIAQEGRNVQIMSSDGEPVFLQEMIQYPKIARATVWNPFNYDSWAAVDNVIRAARGLKTWDTYNMPMAYIDTTQEAKTALSAAPNYYSPPDFNYQAMFKKLWSGK